MTHHDTIIIGGGVAGLGCARTLHDAGYDDFVVLTKDLQGSIPESPGAKVNYGAYYVQSNYHNVLPFVDVRRRIRLSEFVWLHEDGARSLYDMRNLPHLFSLLRFVAHQKSFARVFDRFKVDAAHMGIEQALQHHPTVKQLYFMPATQFVTEHKLQYWSKYFINHVSRTLGFVNVTEVSALEFCVGLLTLVLPMYEFDYRVDRLTKPFRKHITRAEVVRVDRRAGIWQVSTAAGDTRSCRNLVVATPASVAKRLLGFTNEINTATSAVMAHVRGVLKPQYQRGRYVLLPDTGDDLTIARQDDDTYLF